MRRCADLTPSQRLVLSALHDLFAVDGCDHHDANVQTQVVASLAEECKVTERSVRQALSRALYLRFLERITDTPPYRYRIAAPRRAAPARRPSSPLPPGHVCPHGHSGVTSEVTDGLG